MSSIIHLITTRVATSSGTTLGALPVSSGGQLAAALEALASFSPVLVTVYLLGRLLIPAILIVCTTRDATAKQRIALLRDYLLHVATPHGHHDDR